MVTTPAHQFPTGIGYSAQRRGELLDWARNADAVIMEDDYDGDFRYDRAPVGALQGLDPERVVYTGSVSKSLAPGLRLGWLIAPAALTERIVARKRTMDLGNPVIDQAVLADFIVRGGYDRQLRRCQRAYRERRDALVVALAEHFPGATVSGIAAGLHIIARLPARYGPEDVFLERAAAAGIALRPLRDCGTADSENGTLPSSWATPISPPATSPGGLRAGGRAAFRPARHRLTGSVHPGLGLRPPQGTRYGRRPAPVHGLLANGAPPAHLPGGASMSYRPRIPSPGRRAVLRGSLIAPAAVVLSPATASAAPALHLAGRPEASWGVQVGGVTASSALLWVRSDRPARMLVETSATESFRRVRRWYGPSIGPGTDFTGTTPLYGLPAGEQVHYRVTLADPADPRRTGRPVYGTFRTAPARRRSGVRFLWSGDIAGQGWGINPDIGGYRVYEEMRRLDPDFFLCSGDSIYADGPLAASVTLPDGRIWRNVMTEEKAKVAETLDEYRGNFRYNLLDRNVRRFNAQVPSVVQWDDHEVRNNWYPGQILDDARYTEKNVDILAARSVRAFHEYVPLAPSYGSGRRSRMYRVVHHGPLLDVFVLDMRSHRNANSPGRQADDTTGILGEEQARWLKRSLAASRAEWKVIAADMPLGLVVPDGATDFEAVAQGDPGAPLGRELQIAELLRFIKHRRITGTVWLTADVHYTSAQHYAPERAAFKDFAPFWEFVSGPLAAGGFPANALDGTFGPDRVFVRAPDRANVSPMESPQYYGEVEIDGDSAELTVRLRAEGGAVLFTKVLRPGRVGQ